MGPLFQVTDLSVTYRGSKPYTAVDRVSFSIERGATLGIIGESGAGKTTLALALTGLLDSAAAAVSGKAELEGRNLLKMSEPELCKVRGSEIGMIFQDPRGSLDPSVRIDAQVSETIRAQRKISRSESLSLAQKQLADTGVGREVLAAAPYAYQLSGGLAQRAMIAMALACSPRLLIADEPTSSLDVTLQAGIIRLLSKLQKRDGLAMVFISHDLALVSVVAERILVLREGRVVEYGDKKIILSHPSHEYTRDLIRAWKEVQLPQQGGSLATA